MRRILFLTWVLTAVLFLSVQSFAQSQSAVLWLQFPAGARAAGMGEAFVALANDATATHWNPAGLGFYPLANSWLEYKGKADFDFKALTLLKNDRPETNYKRYDLWAISPNKLYTWDGEEWLNIPINHMPPEDTSRGLDSLNCLSSDEKNLWLGTNNGLFKYDGRLWSRFSMEDGLPTNRILSLDLTPSGTIWLGTDSGVVKFDGKGFSRAYLAEEVKNLSITQIAAKSDNDVWAATQTDLLKLERNLFTPYYISKVESIEGFKHEIKKFLGREDSIKLEIATKRIEALNYIVDEQVIAQLPLKIEYSLALEGQITCLSFDRKGGLLVGTDMGFLKLEDGKWKRYGYRKYEVRGDKTVEEVAAKFLPYKDKERTEALAWKIMQYNHLLSRELHPGQILYVYTNSLGSKILSISMEGDENLFVGTEFGTLRYDGESWERYYHAGLERAKTHTVICKDEDIFFGTDKKAVVYAHAKREFTFMHSDWLKGLGVTDEYYEYLFYVQNTENWGTIGGNIIYVSHGSIPITTETAQQIGEINPYEFALTLSYGTRVARNLSLGLGAKYIHSVISQVGAGKEKGEGKGNSFAVDLGLLYRTPFKKLTLGMAVTNLGPKITYIDADQADPLPRNLALGAAYDIFDTPYNKFTAVGEIDIELVDETGGFGFMTKEAKKNVGIEYWYANYLALRAGYFHSTLWEKATTTLGAGLRIGFLTMDFAYIPEGGAEALSRTTRISGTLRF